jgi:L-ascorbate metabolism protein UlaG (beta-lactamase superfamily)
MKSLVRWLALAVALAVPAAFAQDGKKVEMLWLGQACWKITTPGGKVIVVDPYLIHNPKTPAAYRDLAALGKVDLILVTHAHGDHFADAPALAKMNNAPVWSAGGLGQSLVALGILPAELAPRFGKGGTITPWGPTGVKITATHAEHASELVWKNPATGKDEVHVGGEPVGYIIELENGFKIYHMGDTGLFGDMKVIGERYRPDVVLIPIGGHFTMDPKDAAYATSEWLKPKYAVPMHYGTYPVLKGTPEEYIKALGNAPVKVFPIHPGDMLSF